MKNGKLIYTISVFAAFALLALSGCGNNGDKVSLEAGDSTAVVEEQPVAAANTEEDGRVYASVEVDETTNEYEAVGSFAAADEVTIGFQVGGTIASLPVDEGDMIRPDTVLARIDPESLELAVEYAQAQLKVADASLKNAQKEYDRKKQLFDDGAISAGAFDGLTAALDLARAQKQSAEVAVKLAEKDLRDSVIRAGISGVVSKRIAAKGEFVDKGNPLLVVSIIKPVKFIFPVPERIAPQITEGQEVRVRLVAYPGQIFTGKVSLISPTVDAVTRTVNIEAVFDNNELLLKPGYFAKGRVTLSRTATFFMVPNRALFPTSDGGYELHIALDGDRVVPVVVEQRFGDKSRITGDLQGGEKLLLNNN